MDVHRVGWLPTDADSQRQRLVRRLAAHDSSMDILGLDVTREAETAQAGWILPWTGANKAAAVQDTLPTIADAKQLAKEGKPHHIEIQGAQYEGVTVAASCAGVKQTTARTH
jgi:multiple sugar transport system substrate-binding protein